MKQRKQPYQRRIGSEKARLDAKIRALTEFIGGDAWSGLSKIDQRLLERQLVAMTTYSVVLGDRILARKAHASLLSLL